jgi:hypothetical protein
MRAEYEPVSNLEIRLNKEELQSIVAANFSPYHNQPVTTEMISSISRQLAEDFEKFLHMK